jgi:hypothetical protein
MKQFICYSLCLILCFACTSVRPWNRKNISLELTMTPNIPFGVEGNVLPISYSLKNKSNNPFHACFARERRIVIKGSRSAVGTWAKGYNSIVDHPTCMKGSHFTLEPSSTLEFVNDFEIPKVGGGEAIMLSTVILLDPNDCDQYGCSAWAISTKWVHFEIREAN